MQVPFAFCWTDSLKDVKEKCLTLIPQNVLNFYWNFFRRTMLSSSKPEWCQWKSSYITPLYQAVCDDQLPEEWYRFVGAAGTKMPTTRVRAYRCGTNWSGWLNGTHPKVKDGEFLRKVCFSDPSTGCKYSNVTIVKDCGSYFIYKIQQPPGCKSRYCGTDWMWSKYTLHSKKTH